MKRVYKRLILFLSKQQLIEILPLIFILSLLPFFHGGEVHVAKLIFFVFPILYIPLLFFRKRYFYKSHKSILFAWLVFIFISFISTYFSISKALSVPRFFETFTIFLYFLLFYFVFEKEEDLNPLSSVILVVGFILSAMSVYFIFHPPDQFPVINLVYSIYGHNHLANYLIFTIPISSVRFLNSKKLKKNIFYGFLTLFFFLNLYSTFGRAAFLIVPIITILILKKIGSSKWKRNFLLSLGLIPILLFFIYLAFSNIEFLQNELETYKSSNFWFWRQVIKPLENEGRLGYWKQAVEGFKLRPILGNGPGTFRLTSNRFKQKETFSWYTHNLILQLACENGLIGLAVFALLMVLIIKGVKIETKSQNTKLPIALGIIGSFLQALFNFNMNFLAINLLAWMLIAVLLKLSIGTKKESLSKRYLLLLFIGCIISFSFAVSTVMSNYYHSEAKKLEKQNQQMASKYFELAMKYPSLEQQRFNSYLDFVKNKDWRLSVDIPINYIISWNKEDPEIYSKLAKIFEQSNNLEAEEYYKGSVEFYPINVQYITSYTDFLKNRNKQTKSIGYFIESANIRFSDLLTKEELEVLNHYKNREDINLEENDFKLLTSNMPNTNDYSLYTYYGRFYYLVGLNYFEQGKYDDTEYFWKLAVKIAPEWSFFHIELANLYAFLENNEMAYDQLNKCKNYQAAMNHCSEYETNTSSLNFDYPGLMSEFIRQTIF